MNPITRTHRYVSATKHGPHEPAARARSTAPSSSSHARARALAMPSTRANAVDASRRASPTWTSALVASLRRAGALDGGGARGADGRRAVEAAACALFERLLRATRACGIVEDDGARELVVDGLDAEQVWTQVDARVAPTVRRCGRNAKALRGKFGADGTSVDGLFAVGVEGGGASDDGEDDGGEDAELSDDDGAEGSDDDEDEADEGRRAKSGQGSSASDRTRKVFKNPGLFSLDDMEEFMDEGDERDARRRAKAENEDDEDDDDEEDEDEDEMDIYRDVSDDDDFDAEDDEEDDLDDAVAYTARLAGVSASSRRKKPTKKSKGKKAQDLMFEDFFGKGKPLGGTKGGRLGASDETELNELSDEEEDMFNALERDEDDEDEDEEEDLEGELETGIAGRRGLENHDDDDDEFVEEEPEEEEEVEEEEEDYASDLNERDEEELDDLDRKLEADLDAELARAKAEEEDEDSDDKGKSRPKSAFQRQQEAIARQIQKLEKEAIGEKSWLLKGEAAGKERPMNSALETDLEFEHVMAPAPVISAEITQKLEDIIKKRIIEGRFDDVERVQPKEERERKELPQLDDTKSTKGLGDIYADEYMKQKVGVALGEKEDPMVAEVKKLWAILSYRLDALSQTGLVEDVKAIEERVERDLAIRALGTVVPMSLKEEDRLAPEEIFAGGGGKGGQRGSAAGFIKADEELTKEERKAGRAKRKRKSKAVRDQKELEKARRDREREAQHKAEEDAGFTRKAPKVAMLAVGSAAGKAKSDFSKSSKVFGMLQDAKEQDAARGGPAKKRKSDSTTNKSSLKLS